MADIHNVLHKLIDAARFHSEAEVLDAHDAVSAHAEGKSLDQFRKDREATVPANVANEDAILEKARQIQAQREASAAQKAQIDAAAQAQRPATPVAAPEPAPPPVAVADTPASPTADPDAAPAL